VSSPSFLEEVNTLRSRANEIVTAGDGTDCNELANRAGLLSIPYRVDGIG